MFKPRIIQYVFRVLLGVAAWAGVQFEPITEEIQEGLVGEIAGGGAGFVYAWELELGFGEGAGERETDLEVGF